MNKELKAKLESKLEEAGLDKGLLTFVNITKEEEIQGVLDNLLKLKTPPLSTEELIKQKEVQSEIDRRISEAKKSWEQGRQEPPTPPAPPKGDLTPETIAAIVAEAQKPLLEKLNGFEQGRTREGKIAQARTLLQESKIPEQQRDFYLELYNPDSETPIAEWVKKSEEKHESYVQSMIDSGSLSKPTPKYTSDTEPTTEELDAQLDSMGVLNN